MTDSEFTIIDHIEDIRVPGRPFDGAANEYWALICLWQGLEFLYAQASLSDQAVKEQLNPEGNIRTNVFGNHPVFDRIPQ
jgi:hypothetical protein